MHQAKKKQVQLPALYQLEWLQGDASSFSDERRKYRLCLLFQVNCPGCHSHAIPLLNEIYQLSRKGHDQQRVWRNVDVYGISTAFEDFDYNTAAATNLLLYTGARVGVPKQQLGEYALQDDEVPHFPVAFDYLVSKKSAPSHFLEKALASTKRNVAKQLRRMGIPNVAIQQKLDKLLTLDNALPDQLAVVFYTVAAQGTPTWILHDEHGRVVDCTFGQFTLPELEEWAENAIESCKVEVNGAENYRLEIDTFFDGSHTQV